MIKFTDIGQFRNTVTDVKHGFNSGYYVELPVMKFIGTVKIHGTNAGVSYSEEDGMWVQSRSRIISTEKDNAGFAFFVDGNWDWFNDTLSNLSKPGYIVTLFGEWCGRNIQKGVAICELSKRFVIFAMKYTGVEDEGDHWYVIPEGIENEDIGIFNIFNEKIPKYEVSVDFSRPEVAQAEMVDIVKSVETECPFAKAFGVSGIGEGVVFSSYDDSGKRTHIFKVKGQKHSVSKVKTLASVDVEKIKNAVDFVEYALTENRLHQGIEQVFTQNDEEPDIRRTGDFLRWLVNDIIKEESDTMRESSLEPKDVGKYISNKARPWFMNYINAGGTHV